MRKFVTRLSLNPKLQMWRRVVEMKSWRYQELQKALPTTNCVDVGASYYPHTSWWLFLGSESSNWLAVEPNESNLSYLKNWPWKAKTHAVVAGLSELGGKEVLHITNIDSGSSLLEPVIPPSMKLRLGESGEKYVFPVRKVEIDTRTLASVLEEVGNYPTIVKLDTQGSELSILKAAINEKMSSKIVGIEIECSLLATPLYKGSPRLWEIALYLEGFGFELLGLDVLPRNSTSKKVSNISKQLAVECDAVFSLRRDVVFGRCLEERAVLFGFYVTNNFHKEAIITLESDIELVVYLENRGLNVSKLVKTLKSVRIS